MTSSQRFLKKTASMKHEQNDIKKDGQTPAIWIILFSTT